MASNNNSNNKAEELILITLASTKTGGSESIQIPPSTTPFSELIGLSRAFFGLAGEIAIFKDGRQIRVPVTASLQDAGIRNGDVLAIQESDVIRQRQEETITPATRRTDGATTSANATTPLSSASTTSNPFGGLDFSNLLTSVGGVVNETLHGPSGNTDVAPAPTPAAIAAGPASSNDPQGNGQNSGGLDFSNLIAAQTAKDALHSVFSSMNSAGGASGANANAVGATDAKGNSVMIYYPGMNLNEAIEHNPNPTTFITLLNQHDHLMKELNYHNPTLATKLRAALATNEKWDKKLSQAVTIWREEMFRGGMQHALQKSLKTRKEQEYTRRIQSNPNDAEAKRYFKEQENARRVEEQYRQMMQEFPESLGRVLMLYVNAKINGHSIQAFVDSGAQATIMSKTSAKECGLLDLLDTRFAGTAVGVGTGKILGRIHIVQLQLGSDEKHQYHFPCTVTVIDDSQQADNPGSKMDFLLGLDMLKRHMCSIDLERGVLRFQLGQGKYMEAPFLHEKDLDEDKGGTKGFDAEKSNLELEKQHQLLEQQEKEEEEQKKGDKNGNNNNDAKRRKLT